MSSVREEEPRCRGPSSLQTPPSSHGPYTHPRALDKGSGGWGGPCGLEGGPVQFLSTAGSDFLAFPAFQRPLTGFSELGRSRSDTLDSPQG